MAIPGLKPSYEVRAKVRVGKKVESRSGKEIPTSVDYFICDDVEFARVVGEGRSELRIFLPYENTVECFSTGLEQWAGQMLVCYAKGEERNGTAYALRKSSMKSKGRDVNLLDGFEVLSDQKFGQDRSMVACRSRDCPMMKAKECKPMGRLQFFIDGIGKEGGVFQLDTKSWHSVENVERTLLSYSDPRGVPFVLRVSFTQQGDKRFPELTLEAEVEVNTPDDVALADALVQLDRAKTRENLAAVLDLTNPGWKQDEKVIQRIKDVGIEIAADAMLRKHLT